MRTTVWATIVGLSIYQIAILVLLWFDNTGEILYKITTPTANPFAPTNSIFVILLLQATVNAVWASWTPDDLKARDNSITDAALAEMRHDYAREIKILQYDAIVLLTLLMFYFPLRILLNVFSTDSLAAFILLHLGCIPVAASVYWAVPHDMKKRKFVDIKLKKTE